ncbi:hypothetical protein V8C40DRAFT_245610 [Trichoderma camerunense]
MDFPSRSMFPPLLAPPESCISLAFPFGKTPLSSLHLLLAYSTPYGEHLFLSGLIFSCSVGNSYPSPDVVSFFLLFLCDSYFESCFPFWLFIFPSRWRERTGEWSNSLLLFFPFFFFPLVKRYIFRYWTGLVVFFPSE